MAQLTAITALAEFPANWLGVERTFSISEDTLRDRYHNGRSASFYEAWLVPDICLNPIAIWRGLRAGEEQSLCYAGQPSGDFAKQFGHEELVETNKPDQVFLAYVTPDGTVTKWRWAPVDSDGTGFPTSHNSRFEDRLWPPH